MQDVIILVSGGVNEDVLQVMMKEQAPIDGFGIGVSLDVSTDAPALDCAYKLQEYAGVPRRKLSEGKATWPGRKQIWRAYDAQGNMRGDVLSLETDKQQGETLIDAGDARRESASRRRLRWRRSANARRPSSSGCRSRSSGWRRSITR